MPVKRLAAARREFRHARRERGLGYFFFSWFQSWRDSTRPQKGQ